MYVDRLCPFFHISESSKVTIAERVVLIAVDVIVVAVTIQYTYGTFKTSREANVRTPFTTMLLRSGEIHFYARWITCIDIIFPPGIIYFWYDSYIY